MCSPCSQGVSSNKNPNRKTCKNRTLSCPSVSDTDGSRGPRALRSCPLLLEGPGGRTVQDGKKQKINSPRPPAYLRVCVSCVASIYARVCSSVSCVCDCVRACVCGCLCVCSCVRCVIYMSVC